MKRVVLSGYTPRVHDPKLLPHLRDKLDREIHKTALGAEDMLDICLCDDIRTELTHLRDNGFTIVGLENNIPEKTVEVGKYNRAPIDKTVLILGEEVHGINPELYDLIDSFVEIPMRGQKESFNVSVAAGIAIYAIMNS